MITTRLTMYSVGFVLPGLMAGLLVGGCGGNARSGNGPDAGGSARPSGPPPRHAALTSDSKLDLLFLIDDSTSMAPLQQRLRARMPEFMAVLKNIPGGMPDVHVAVVSSSLGAGIFGNVTGCVPGGPGNTDGNFQSKTTCGLGAGETYLKSTGGTNPVDNFAGDIADVFSCMADLGQGGCGFESQLESVHLALQKSVIPGTTNAGFLRPDAMLSVVFLTNEDDCSVPATSMLFDPNQQSISDPLGGLQSYRCNEFGHRCDQPLPHTPSGAPVTLTNCTSAEDGKLTRVNDFIDFLYGLKPGAPEKIFVTMISGPTAPYVIESKTFTLGTGDMEPQPSVAHACTSATAANVYADPSVRLNQVAQAFAPNTVISSICDDDFGTMMTNIAEQMVGP